MEYQKIINLLDNEPNQPSKFFWVEINDESRGTYNTGAQIKFKTTMLKSILCNCSDAYIPVKGKIEVDDTSADDADANNTNKKVIFKNCAPSTDCISEINNTQVDNELWQYCKDIHAVNNKGDIVDFNGPNATDSFNFETKITGQTDDDGEIKNVEIMVPLKYLSNIWKTLEMPLINCEVSLILTWSANYGIVYTNIAHQGATFVTTEAKLYAPVATLSTQDNAKLLPQLKSGLKDLIETNT